MKIYVFGDIHADWASLNTFINKKKPDIVLQCGDFGYWPKFVEEGKHPKPQKSKIYWCDGNHEDHWALKYRTTDELWPGVFYMPRGSTLTLPDGRVVLFMGGANSIDKGGRTLGFDWFPEETISYEDFAKLDPNLKVDIVISHTSPLKFGDMTRDSWRYEPSPDPSRVALDRVLEMYRPALWYFGHWHCYKTGYAHKEGCRWTALGYPKYDKWWIDLPN